MKKSILLFLICFIHLLLSAQDDGMNEREIYTYTNEVEVARVSITFMPGFETSVSDNLLAYIDPDLPLNGGGDNPVTDGEFNMNYIRVFEPIHNNYTDIIPVHNNVDYENDWKESITYFDGLGRDIQQVLVKASSYGNDIIKPIVYDEYGRRKVEYLPYAIAQDEGNYGPGGYRPTPETEIVDFYNCYFNATDAAYPYGDKVFDGSPLNRVMEQSSPGHDWSLDESHTLSTDYSANGSDRDIYMFEVSETNQLMKVGLYSDNTLYKFTYTDEDNNESVEYKDVLGRVICKIVKTGSEELITQYVYDDFGLLRFVLPPLTFSNLPTGTTPQTFDLNTDWIYQLCFYYQYDGKMRMAKKKMPGSDEVYMIYNDRDQLILTQDGVLRLTNDWLFTKYDVFNRSIITGKYNHGSDVTQVVMQNLVNNSTCTLYETYIDGSGYSNTSFPIVTSSSEILTTTYYDSYQALELFTASVYDFNPDDISFYFLESNSYSSKIKGLPTITCTKVLTHDDIQVVDDWLTTFTYYDKYEHVIQTIVDNHLGGQITISSLVNFTGEIEETKETIDVGWESTTLQQKFSYDHSGQLIETQHKINNQDWSVLNKNKYNELGQLTKKSLHKTGDNYIEDIKYKYNIRGWLSDINDITNPDDDLFTMNLEYNDGGLYNGNIAGMKWTSSYFNSLKQYDFTYDGAGRLTNSYFDDVDKYTTHYQYDKNGNIELLTRMGELGGSGTFDYIDYLNYEYTGNQLKYVNDNTGNNCQENGFTDNGSFLTTNEYLYDENGNLKEDLNKQICNIDYNFLNLPQRISFDADAFNVIDYLYTADGRKLQKSIMVNNEPDVPTSYLGSIVYIDDAIDYIITTEGRAVSDDYGEFGYEYFLKDHLGNTRVSFDEKHNVLQGNSYYPFGMSMGESLTYLDNSAKENKYRYNGKEMQDDFGLDWYDYGARMYDEKLIRFSTPDPLADKFTCITSYSYCLNNPTNFIDPDGREPFTLALVGKMVGGALIGAGIDITVQMTANMTLNDQGFWDAANNIDWTSVGASAVTGAIGIPGSNVIPNSIKLAATATAITVDAMADVSSANGNQNVFNGEKSLSNAMVDATSDVIGGKLSENIIKGAKNLISSDMSSGTFKTLNNAEKSTLGQTQSVINSQVFEETTKTFVGMVSTLVNRGANSIAGKEILAPKVEIYSPVADNTNIVQTSHVEDPISEHYRTGTLY